MKGERRCAIWELILLIRRIFPKSCQSRQTFWDWDGVKVELLDSCPVAVWVYGNRIEFEIIPLLPFLNMDYQCNTPNMKKNQPHVMIRIKTIMISGRVTGGLAMWFSELDLAFEWTLVMEKATISLKVIIWNFSECQDIKDQYLTPTMYFLLF